MDWKLSGAVAGQVRSGGGLTFAAVEGAGHMVPMDQPAAVSGICLYILVSWSHGPGSSCK